MSDRKRALDGSADSPASKKLKSVSSSNGTASATPALSADALVAQKRAEIAAKLAAMKKSAPGAAPTPLLSTVTSSSASVAEGPKPAPDDMLRRIAEAKRRVTDAQNMLAVKDNPYMSMPQKKKGAPTPEPAQQGAGLKMAAHPLLLDSTPAAPQSKKDRYKPMQPKFASIKANVRNVPTPPPTAAPVPAMSIEAKANPYTQAAPAAGESDFDGAPRERTARRFRFNPKGKYTQIADQVRKDAQLEALKQRIAAGARKAGLDAEFETLEKNIKREAPPDAEWWDIPLLPNKTYDDLANGFESLNIRNATSPVTIYVQHPIPIPAPQDKNKVTLKPLKLTTKEQKKMRKQRRQAELQDKRDRIRMGLIPPDAPKVRLTNVMKVLTSDAVQDPTKVEARVRREVAMRKHTHEKMNAERKLTDEQRREKIENKKHEQEKNGIYGCVFKVNTLADAAHRFKVRKNAEQQNLAGLCIFHSTFSMVYVEGSAKAIRWYKKLMLSRIAWTQAAQPRGNDVELDNGHEDGDTAVATTSGMASTEPGAEVQAPVSLDDNRCDLVWEGQLRERAFSGFKPKTCPTDATAKEALGVKLAPYWDMTKQFKPSEEELF